MMNPRLKKYLPLVIGIIGIAAFVVYKHYYSNDKVADGAHEIIQMHDIGQGRDAPEDVTIGNNSNYDILDNSEANDVPENDALEHDASEYEPQTENEQMPRPDPDLQINSAPSPSPSPSNETPPASVEPEITAPHPTANPTPQPEPIDPLTPPLPQPPERDVECQPRDVTQPVFMVIPKN